MILTDERFKKTKLICNENYERMRGMQMEVAGFLALGILLGLLGALLGIGGGMVIVRFWCLLGIMSRSWPSVLRCWWYC